MSQASDAFFALANGMAATAKALSEGDQEVKNHPLIQRGFDAQQLMAIAEFVAQVGHFQTNIPDPDSVGAYVDRFASQSGTHVKIIINPEKELGEDEYRMDTIEELARLAQLPAAIATDEEIATYREHPLVKKGAPSVVLIQIAAQRQSIDESMTFNNIVNNLQEEDPAVFGPETPPAPSS